MAPMEVLLLHFIPEDAECRAAVCIVRVWHLERMNLAPEQIAVVGNPVVDSTGGIIHEVRIQAALMRQANPP